MASDLTHHDEIRRRILITLVALKTGELSPSEALDRVYNSFSWTADDDTPFPRSKTGQPRWRKRATTQRNRMANDGLIDRRDTSVWKLTEHGQSEALRLTASAQPIHSAPDSNHDTALAISNEAARREELWAALLARGGPLNVRQGLPRAVKIYGNAAGVFVPSAETRIPATPKGIALSFLTTGRHYADELAETGAIYHYPKTGRSGHDEAEIEACKAAFRAGLPVFVISPGEKSTTRNVHRGFIDDVDDTNRVLLITFTDGELPPPPTKEEYEAAFKLTDDDTPETYSRRKNRPNQARFAFDVVKRYGAVCAVCEVSGSDAPGLVQAAHLLPKKRRGADDARNGLPLCANHHLAFDRDYWCIDPDLKIHVKNDGPALEDLAITCADLSHLPRKPHPEPIAKVWSDWQRKQSQKG